jgi:two-component system LytT family sensor kinase
LFNAMKVNSKIDNLLGNPKTLFWYCQLSFWLVIWIAHIIINPIYRTNWSSFLIHTISVSIAFFLTLLLRYIYKKYSWHQLPWTSLIPRAIVCSIFLSVLWIYAVRLILYAQTNQIEYLLIKNFISFLESIYYYSFGILLWSVLYFGYKIWDKWNREKLQAEREHALAQSAQLEVLRYQLNPHFLFNTLSSLRALIRVDSERAQQMITQISEFLRYSLLEGKNNEVPLSREIEIIRHYLSIEKVRFRDKLMVEYAIDPLAEDYPVPVFLIHHLVENAIKHGMHSSPLPLQIKIQAQVFDERLQIDVINTGKWIDVPSPSSNDCTGTGLRNTRKRLEYAYPNNHTFEIIKGEEQVHIRITLKKELRQNDGKKI